MWVGHAEVCCDPGSGDIGHQVPGCVAAPDLGGYGGSSTQATDNCTVLGKPGRGSTEVTRDVGVLSNTSRFSS